MKVSSIANDPENGSELSVEFDCGCKLVEKHNYEPRFESTCDDHTNLADMSASDMLDNATGLAAGLVKT